MLSYILWILALIFVGGLIVIFYRKFKFEKTLPKEVRRSRRFFYGTSVYVDRSKQQTIVCYEVWNKVYFLDNFELDTHLVVGDDAILMDYTRKKFCICVHSGEAPICLPAEAIQDIEILQKTSSKTKTQGGVFPIPIKGYYVASVTKKRVTMIESVFLRISYMTETGKSRCTLKALNHSVESNQKAYRRAVDQVVKVKERLEYLQTKS